MLIWTICTVLFAVYARCGTLTPTNSQSLLAYSSNKGESTYYQFQFTPQNGIGSNASIQVIFPNDFDYISFPDNPDCYLQLGASAQFQSANCTITKQGVANVQAGSIPVDLITIVVGQIINPKFKDTSSQFSVRTYYNTVPVDINDIFGIVSFAAQPCRTFEFFNPNVYQMSNGRISEGSSWEFDFIPQKSYSSGNSFRFTFPDGFNSNKVLCNVQGLTGNDPITTVSFNKRMITCQNVMNPIQGNQVVRIINMRNPNFSGIMQGFTIEILQGTSTVVLEKIQFPGNIIISPGQPTISYVSSDQFKYSNSTYSFFINLVNPVYAGDKLYINFTSEWFLFNPNCTVINGFQQIGNQPVRCSLIPNSESYVIDNFDQIDKTQRLVLSIFLQTPKAQNLYPVTIATYNTKRSAIVDLNTVTVSINATYGVVKQFVAHPLKQPQVALAGKTGSLEMTFFLKTYLPNSDVDSFGKFRVDIFPQIPIPPSSTYGPVKCYFYGDIPSANECSDTTQSIFATNADLSKTTIYMYTPKDYSYQRSEVPITVTTTGLDQNYYKGFALDPLVQRYYFHVHIWSRQNTGIALPAANTPPDIPPNDNTPPDEVYFQEFIPAYRVIDGPPDPDLTKLTLPNKPTYLTAPNLNFAYYETEANQFTYVSVTYTHQDTAVKSYTIRSPQSRNYIMRIYFVSGWAAGLGYTTPGSDKIIKNYPCLINGNINYNNPATPQSACDLFIGTPTPYLQVNNLQTLNFDVGTYVTVIIPRVKLANTPGVVCSLNVEIDEETPGFREDVVIVYKSLDRILFTITNPPAAQTSGLTFSPSTSVLNQNPTYSITFSQPVTTINMVTIDWDPNLPISFAQVDCSGTSGIITCTKFGAPVWQIYATGIGVQQSTVNIILPLSTSVNPAYEMTLTFVARSYGTDFKQKVNKIGTFYFPPLVMTTSTFTSLTTQPNYWFQGYVSSHQITFQLVQPVPDNWYIQFDFQGGITVNNDEYFIFQNNDNTVLQALDQRGVLLSFQGSTFVIWNLKAVAATKIVSVSLSLTLPLTLTCAAAVAIKTEYQNGFSMRRVNWLNPPTNHADGVFQLNQLAMVDFKVINPINYLIIPQESQVAPFNFNFTPDVTLKVGDTITLSWIMQTGAQNGFAYQINPVTSNPYTIICSINGANYPCTASSTSTFLVVTITLNSSLVAGVSYSFQVSTDIASNYNGLIYPTTGGYYQFKISTYTLTPPSSVYTQNFSQYIFIRPKDFTDLTFSFAHTTASSPTVYEISFILNRPVNAYSQGGRFIIYFPIQSGSNANFASDLGLGSSNPGCWFNNAFSKESSANKLMCVLTQAGTASSNAILSEYSARLEIINFQALTAGTSYQIIIGKIKNPAMSSSPFQLTFMTYNINNQYQITYLNSMIQNIYIGETNDSQTPQTSTQMITFNGKVQDANQDLVHSIINSQSSMQDSDYFVAEYPSNYFSSTNNQGGNQNQGNINTCDTSKYYYCISMDDVKWVIWKIKTTIAQNTAQSANISLLTNPLFISRADVTFNSYLFVQKKYQGQVIEKVPIASWNSLISTITSPSMNQVNSVNYYRQSRSAAEIIVQFTTSRDLYATGSIVITFDSSYVPYAQCRSDISLGSKLYSSAANNLGDIGCYVQANSWYITGFQDMAQGSTVYIYGLVDMPATTASFSITTFGNQLDANIISSGYTIETISSVPSITLTTFANFQFDTTMALIQASPLQVGYTGDLRISIKSSQSLSGTFKLSLAQTKLIGSTTVTDGFQSLSSLKQYIIGYAIDQSNGSIIPFYFDSTDVTKYTEASNFITVQFTLYQTLTANKNYIIVVTTQQMDATKTDGIIWPLQTGVYKVEISFPTQKIFHTEFVEVYGQKFNTLNFYSTNNGVGLNNLIYISFTPAVQIATTDQLIIEFNTQSLDSINLFGSDLGLGMLSYTQLNADFLLGTNAGTCSCRLYNGYQPSGVAVKVVCTQFSSVISTSAQAKIFFQIVNPSSVPEDTYIPIFIYSIYQTPTGEYKKDNWQIVEQQFNIKSSAVSTSGTTVTPTRSNSAMGASNIQITFQVPVAFSSSDMLIININDLNIPTPSTVDQTKVSCTSGTMFLLVNNKILACQFNSAVTSGSNIIFQGLISQYYFSNLFTALSTTQLTFSAYASFLSNKSTQSLQISCNSMSQLTPYSATATDITIPNPTFIPTSTIYQYVDALFEINSINLNQVTYIKFTHSLTGITLDSSKSECLMAPNSQIEIIQCYQDGTLFYLTINPPNVATTKKIQFITRNKPMQLPSSTSTISYQPIAQFYDSQNNLIFQSNVAVSNPTLFSQPTPSVPSPIASFTTFSAGVLDDNSETRYFDQEPFSLTNTDFGPLVFKFCPQENISIGQTISFIFSNNLVIINSASQITGTEIYQYSLYCKINGLIQTSCTFNTGTIVVTVAQALTQYTNYNFYIDTTNQQNYPSLHGFKWNMPNNSVQSIMKVQINTPTLKFLSDLNFFAINQAYKVKAITSTTSINYAHKVAGQKNMLTLNLNYAAVSAPSMLIVEFESYSQASGTQLYNQNTMHGLSDGDQFPCSGGTGSTPITCWIQTGSIDTNSMISKPIRIFIKDMAGTTGTYYLFIENPQQINYDLRIRIRSIQGTSMFTLQGTYEDYQLFRTVTNTDNASPQSQTISVDKPYSDTTAQYTLPLQNTSGNVLVYSLISVTDCNLIYQNSQSDMMYYYDVSSQTIYLIRFTTAAVNAASPYKIQNMQCNPTTITYYEASSSQTSWRVNTGSLSSTSITGQAATTYFSIVPSYTQFFPISGYTNVYGVITFQSSQAISIPSGLQFQITFQNGITLIACQVRRGLYQGSNDLSYTSECSVTSGTQIQITGFTDLKANQGIEILLNYDNGSSVGSNQVNIQLSSNSYTLAIGSLSLSTALTTNNLGNNSVIIQSRPTSNQYLLSISITPNTNLYVDSITNILNVDITLNSEYLTNNFFGIFQCLSQSSVSIISQSARQFIYQNNFVVQSSASKITLQFTAQDTSASWSSGDTFSFTLILDNLNLQQTTPFNHVSSYLSVTVNSYTQLASQYTSTLVGIVQTPTLQLYSSVSTSSISAEANSLTEIQITGTLQQPISNTNNEFVVLQFYGQAWPDDIISNIGSSVLNAQVDCLVYVQGSLQTSAKCYRHYKRTNYNSILLYDSIISVRGFSALSGQSLNIYIPQVATPTASPVQWSLKINKFSDATLNVSVSQSTGALTEDLVTSFQGTVGSVLPQSAMTISNLNAFKVGSSTPAITLNGNFQVGDYIYIVMVKQSSTSNVLDSTTLCVGPSAYLNCRVYGSVQNIFVFNFLTAQTNFAVSLLTTTLNMISYTQFNNNYEFSYFYYNSFKQINNSPTYQFKSVSFTTQNKITSKTYALFPITKYLTTYFYFTIIAPQDFTSNAQIQITISSSNLAISSCRGYYQASYTNRNSFKCSVSSYTIAVFITQQISSGQSINFLVSGIVQDTNNLVFSVNYYNSYSSSTQYTQIGIDSITINNTGNNLSPNQATVNCFQILSFYPINLVNSLSPSTYAPVRVKFSSATDINSSFNSLIVYFFTNNEFTDQQYAAGITTQNAFCTYKQINSDGTFSFLSTQICTMTYSNPLTYVTASQPLLGTQTDSKFNQNTEYELIISSQIRTNNPGLSIVSISSNLQILTGLLINFSATLYGEFTTPFIAQQYTSQIQNLYYTSKSQGSLSSIYLSINTLTTAAYPSEYMEIVIPDHASSAFIALSSQGKQLPCDLQQATSPLVLQPFCVVNKRGNDIVIKILSVSALSAGTISIAIDDITLYTPSNLYNFQLIFNSVAYDTTSVSNQPRFYNKNRKVIYYLFQIGATATPTASTPTMNLYNNQFGSSNAYLQFTQNIANILVNNVIDKVQIRLQNGMFVLPQNQISLTNQANFCELNTNQFLPLWVNRKTQTFYGQKNTDSNIQPSIRNLKVPNVNYKNKFSTSPSVVYSWYVGNVNTQVWNAQIQSSLDTNNFNQVATSFSIVTDTLNTLITNGSTSWLTITLNINTASTDFNTINNANVMQIILTAQSGINNFLECLYILNTGVTFQTLPCEVSSQTSLKISFDSSITISQAWKIYVRAIVSSNSFKYGFQLYQYADNSATSLSNTVWSFTSSSTNILTSGAYDSSFTLFTQVAASIQKYFNNYYERQIQNIVPGFANLKEGNFQFLPDQIITSGTPITFAFQNYPNPIIDPQSKTLFCVIQKQISQYSYGFGRKADCTHSSGTFTITTPQNNIQANTILITARLDISQSGMFNTVYSSPQRQEIQISYNSKINSEVLNLKNPFYKITYTQYSNTQLQWDYLELNLSLKDGLSAGSATQESIIYIEFPSGVYPYDIGLKSLYALDSVTFQNGQQHDFKGTSGLSSAFSNALYGYTSKSQGFKFAISGFSTLSQQNNMLIKIPLIQNGAANTQIMLKISTQVWSSSNQKYPITYNEITIIKNTIFTNPIVSTCNYVAAPTANGSIQQSGSSISIRLQVNQVGAISNTNGILIFKPTKTLNGYNLNSWSSASFSGVSVSNKDQYSQTQVVVLKFSSSTAANLDMTANGFTSSDEQLKFQFSFMTAASNSATLSYCDLSATQSQFNYYSSPLGSNSVTVLDPTSNNKNSYSIVNLTFNVRKLPAGSIITISVGTQGILNNHFIHAIYCSGTALSTQTNKDISVNPTNNDSQLIITGFNQVASGSQIVILLGLKTQYTPSGTYVFNYMSVGPNGGKIEIFDIGSIVINNQQPIRAFSTNFQFNQYVGPGQWGPIMIQYKLRNTDVNYANSNSKLLLTVPSGFTLATGGVQNIRYQQTNTLFWTNAIFSQLSSNPINIKPPNTPFDMIHNIEYNMLVETKMSASNNNGWQYPSTYGYYQFILQVFNQVSSLPQEIGYDYFLVAPQPDQNLLLFQPLHRQSGHMNVFRFQWRLAVSAVTGDEIWIEFQTNNGNYNDNGAFLNFQKSFANDLGTGTPNKILDCVEGANANIISNSKLFCDVLYPGDDTQTPPNEVPAIVRIKITNNIAQNQVVEFFVGGVKNPLYDNRRSVVKVSLRKTATQSGFTYARKVPYQISPGEFTTTAPTSFFNAASPTPEINYLPSQPIDLINNYQTSFSASGHVWDTAQTHTWRVYSPITMQNGDWILVIYTLANNSQMSQTCGPVSQCYVFPSLGWVIWQIQGVTVPSNYNTFSLTNMNNALYRYNGNFQVEHWKSTGLLLTAYATSGLTYNFDSTGITIQIRPTLTPQDVNIQKYWLTDFWNIAQFNITGIWKYKNIRSFWVYKPTALAYFDVAKKYCNATISIPNNQRKPYPWRMNCQIYDQNRLYFETTTDIDITLDLSSYVISLFADIFIAEFTPSGLTDPFIIYSSVLPITSDNQNYGVTQITISINVSPYIQPDLRQITFNQVPFMDSIARAGDLVEFYMLLQPMTPLSQNRIDTMVFRIPNEFNYPAIKSLDQCTIIGKTSTPVSQCNLQRSYGYTYVTVIPDVTYDNSVKIISLSDSNIAQLFQTPSLPGNQYNITVFLYANNVLLEHQTINITRILGYAWTVNSVKMINHIDALYNNLYYFQAQLGSQNIQPGYDTPAATMYTSLEYTFDNNVNQFLQDLGTGLQTGSQIPCLGGPTLTTYVQKKLTCILTVGTGPQNPPTINVFGYDLIPAGTVISMYFPTIQNLDVSLKANTYTGVRIYYKWINYSAIFYEPYSVQTAPATALNSLSPSITTATTTSNNQVGQTRDYTFSFSLSGNLATTDYLIFNFPQYYFDQNADYSSVSCTGYKVLIFRVSNQIFLQPQTQQSGTVSVVIQGLINPSYSQNIAVTIQGFQFSGLKMIKQINYQINQNLNSPILPCNKFTTAFVVSDSIIGGQNGATLTVTFVTGHYIPPTTGALSVFLPVGYPYNLYDMQTQCVLVGFDKNAQCSIGSATRMDIFLNGNTLNPTLQYQIIMKNINTFVAPTSPYNMIIQSYFNSNIYLQQIICQQTIPYPSFSSNQMGSCSLIVNSSVLNVNTQSIYSFLFQCQNIVRNNTIIEIVLPVQYQVTNRLGSNLKCFSNQPSTLGSSSCTFVQSNLQYVIRANVQSIESQNLFSVSVYINNPKQIIQNGYTFSANFYSYSILYAQANMQNSPIILKPQVVPVTPNQLTQAALTNIPKNAGQSSTYVFTIPPSVQLSSITEVDSVQIQFPILDNLFASTLGTNLECGVYLSQVYDVTFLTYVGLLQMTNGRNSTSYSYTKLTCKLIADYTLYIDTSKVVYPIQSPPSLLKNINAVWQYWIIRNVYNPLEYNPAGQFQITYFLGSTIQWQLMKNLVYYITQAPQYMKVSNATALDNNIRMQTQYLFDLYTQYPLPGDPVVGISLILPPIYKTVASLYTSPLNNCQILQKQNQNYLQTLYCDIYNLEVLAQKAELISLNSTQNISLVFNQLINPNLQYSCQANDINQFKFKIFDWNSGDILFVTSPSIDDKNCISFVKNYFSIDISGPLVVNPGLSYKYTITLEKPADSLLIIPNSPTGSILFDPQVIDMSNFVSSQATFTIKYRSDLLPSNYVVTFSMQQNQQNQTQTLVLPPTFYLPILPLNINVVNVDSSTQPTIKVENLSADSIGYPIRVPVTLSAAPASALYLSINVVESVYNSMIIINPPLLQINPGVTSTYFTIQINTATVPQLHATLSFSLTSYYTIVHQLIYTVKYISFSLNSSYSKSYSVLTILESFRYFDTASSQVGQAIVSTTIQTKQNYQTLQQLSPKVMQFTLVSAAANSATFAIYSSQVSTISYVYSLYGYPSPNNVQQIQQKTYQYALGYGELPISKVIAPSSVLDHFIQFTISSLQGQTNYQIFYYVWNQFGQSSIQSLAFKTAHISYGSIIQIPLTTVTPISDIIIALSKVLQISQSRLICTTDLKKIQQNQDSFNPDIMLKSSIYYSFVIAPNAADDSVKTSTLVNLLQNDVRTRTYLDTLLPQFDIYSKIQSQQIITSIPKVDIAPYPVKINYNNATFSLRLWDQGFVYAVVIEEVDVTQNNPPVSIQIFKGVDQFNKPISNYKVYQGQTDSLGYVNIFVDDLTDGTYYQLFITISSQLPYQPLNLLDDSNIIVVPFQTPFNLNIGDFDEKIQAVQQVNPQLAEALYRFLY
ncbi:hypothetical protein TTHERM_00262980 (macronuclear) [Tetrahymena thermophila SB210]|uniref:Transmembrane protein n=1 Tax=Tetrahymena thermophila (strain SB210) TaxID=312017 RepID=Q22U85_TETTS|nr:hypothetical protein TTHERM_00262980 [Tetrahymena thermophila SB210]EAR88802.2 hypothetical protein TTHERM_00262980 [Tetrahymena thermophila SB210]|eukprot:XP_001009047.2 hypothetical protein TTHERM_00262980 [Tetrahymena thermophila SB210]